MVDARERLEDWINPHNSDSLGENKDPDMFKDTSDSIARRFFVLQKTY